MVVGVEEENISICFLKCDIEKYIGLYRIYIDDEGECLFIYWCLDFVVKWMMFMFDVIDIVFMIVLDMVLFFGIVFVILNEDDLV